MNDANPTPERNNAFNRVPPTPQQYSTQDLSHTKHLTADMGKCMPVMILEAVPGDVFDIGQQMLIRTQALLAPVMDTARATIHTFFVPKRLCWPKIDSSGDNWETYLTGGATGLVAPTPPTWNVGSGNHDVGSMWDYAGLPTWSAANNFTTAYPDAIVPSALPRRAYNIIMNEYFRDQTLQTELAMTNELLFNRNWTKDFFTSALPTQQRGTAPALPVTGSAQWTTAPFAAPTGSTANLTASSSAAGDNKIGGIGGATQQNNIQAAFNANVLNATSVNVSSLRLTIATQQLMEKTMVGGARYIEYLQAVYGTSPRNDTLDRPEYVGGVSQQIVFSEVLQTSATSTQPTPQGTMAGSGISVGQNFVGKYRCEEFGYVISILTVMPEPSYSQGIPKMWLRQTRFDEYNPYYNGLSEQGVLNQELYLTGDGANTSIFGYQARFNEMRYERSTVHGKLRTNLDYWTLTRKFAARPALNSAFIQLTDAEVTTLKRVTPVNTEPWLVIQIGNMVRAKRPIPAYATPGLQAV